MWKESMRFKAILNVDQKLIVFEEKWELILGRDQELRHNRTCEKN